jgi:hypothetical protein
MLNPLKTGPFFKGDDLRKSLGEWDLTISSVLHVLRVVRREAASASVYGLNAHTFSHL